MGTGLVPARSTCRIVYGVFHGNVCELKRGYFVDAAHPSRAGVPSFASLLPRIVILILVLDLLSAANLTLNLSRS